MTRCNPHQSDLRNAVSGLTIRDDKPSTRICKRYAITEALSETSALDGVSGFPAKSLTKPHSVRLQLLIT